jgi:hypothetical protein
VTEKNTDPDVLKDLYALNTPEYEQVIFSFLYLCTRMYVYIYYVCIFVQICALLALKRLDEFH